MKPKFEDKVLEADDLLIQIKNYNPDFSDDEMFYKVYEFGLKAHGDQTRASGVNYFKGHPAFVALHLAEIGMDADMIYAGLLHDTIEDTDVTNEEIHQAFGQDIAFLVEGVSKLGVIKYHGNERHVESLRKFFVAIADDVRVVILKLCDRWHNLETLHFLGPEKQKRIALESMQIHGQLASRLAMGKLTSIINDLAFPYAYPEEYAKTKKTRDLAISRTDETVEAIYRDTLLMLTELLGYTPTIDRRTKGLYSLYKKLERKDWAIEGVYDFIAIRVITDDAIDCYRALGAIHGKWKPVPGRVKDYIAVPKPNGYQSLHTAIFSGRGNIVEVQIRTKDMHEFAEYGIAAHHGYKHATEASQGSGFNWIQQLGEMQLTAEDASTEYLKELRTDFFQDRIFAMTPRGDVIDMPRGATVLDFAFAVHTELGMQATGGTVNGVYRSLKTELQSEDIVKISINKNVTPKRDWLEWSVTNLAHTKIRNSLGMQIGRQRAPRKNRNLKSR